MVGSRMNKIIGWHDKIVVIAKSFKKNLHYSKFIKH